MEKSLTDTHVHLAALPDGRNGCFVSKKFLKRWITRLLLSRQGLDVAHPAEANQRYVERLVRLLGESRYVKRAVVLGMDGVYDERGELDRERTHFLVANDYLFEVCLKYPKLLLPGVSINPRRRDCLQELEKCVQRGAVLVKVLPNTQGFNPADTRHRAFYQKLAKYKLPLLTHVGREFTLVGENQSFGDLANWRLALEERVTLIAAHGASHGLIFREKHFNVALDFCQRYPNFYLDTSALTIPNRVPALFFLKKHPEIANRLIFGTDYPLPVFAAPSLVNGWEAYQEASQNSNPFDRHFLVLQSFGLGKPKFNPRVLFKSAADTGLEK